MSKKRAFLIVTDLHLSAKNIRGRIDYTAESKFAWNKVESVVDKYLDTGYEVVVLFLGDIFHNSYVSIIDAITANNMVINLRNKVHGIYSVVGNHETTYYADNPFWTLMTTIESDRLKTVRGKMWKPQGVLNVIEVPDEIVYGDTRFVFNHYDVSTVKVDPVEGMKTVGLFHQDLYNRQLLQYARDKYGLNPYEHKIISIDSPESPLRGYDYAFVGHGHLLYGEWMFTCDYTSWKTNLQYLSTLGRTNEKEVNDNFLERDIPAMLFENGKLVGKESNKFNLMPRSDSVIEKVIQENKEKYEVQKIKQQIKKQHVSGRSGDPVKAVRESMPNKIMLALFDESLGVGNTSYHADVIMRARSLIWKK